MPASLAIDALDSSDTVVNMLGSGNYLESVANFIGI